MQLELSQFFPLGPIPSTPRPLPQAIPTPFSMPTGHAYMSFGYSISYAWIVWCVNDFLIKALFSEKKVPPSSKVLTLVVMAM